MRAFISFLGTIVFGFSLLAAEPGLQVESTGTLTFAGKPYRGLGVNYYDAFVRTLAEPSRTNYDTGFRVLAERGIPFARFSAGGYWPVEWGLYRTNRASHFARLDAVVQSAERHGVGLIPSLFWFLSTVPDVVGEPCDQWGNTNSKTIRFMRDYTREVVARYRNSSAIWAWEFGNEYNLPTDLPNAAQHRPPVVPELGTPAQRTARDEISQASVRTALAEFAREVRRHDPQRLIISGNAFPRVSAWHQQHEGSWGKDSSEQFAEMLAADNPDPIQSLCVRLYEPTDASRLEQAMAVARRLKKPLFVGEFGVPGIPSEESRKRFAGQLELIRKHDLPLAALWVFDFDGQAADWNVTADNARKEQLDAVAEANRRLRRQAGN